MVDKVRVREVKTIKVLMGARGLSAVGRGSTIYEQIVKEYGSLSALMTQERGNDFWITGGDAIPNRAPVVSGAVNLDAFVENTSTFITKVALISQATDADGDTLVPQLLSVTSGSIDVSVNGWTLTPPTDFIGTIVINYQIYDGTTTTAATAIVTVVADLTGVPLVSSNYILTRATLAPDLTGGMPSKGVTTIDPITGCSVTRITDASTDMQQSTQTVNGYSRYSQENSNESLYMGQGTNSTSSTIFSKDGNAVVAYLAYDDSGNDSRTIGMSHEMRWDKTGNFPNRIYYRNGTSLFKIEDVTQNNNADRSNPTRSLIKDFDSLVTWPAASNGMTRKVYNDQEGDCSLDCDHWAFMAAYYDGTTWRVAAIIHYQISTDTTHVMHPSDLAGAPLATYELGTNGLKTLDGIKNDDYFKRRPNMVEISPLGTGLLIHTGRTYAGQLEELAGTWFDGPYLWPLDLDWTMSKPFRVSITETHSGWAWARDGRELFVSQDNRRDVLIAVYIAGANKGYLLNSDTVPGDDSGVGCIDFANHIDLSWTGFHFAQMPRNRPGWIMVSTYSGTTTEWADHQLLMMEIAPEIQTPFIWRVSPMYSLYADAAGAAKYWDEAPASVNMQCNSILVSQNWGVADGASNEVLRYDIPNDWDDHLGTSQGNVPVLVDQTLTVVQGVDLLITLGPLQTDDGATIVYGITGAGATLGPAANEVTFNSTNIGDIILEANGNDGRGNLAQSFITVTVTASVIALLPVVADQNLPATVSEDLVITLGDLLTPDGKVVTYVVTGSTDITVGPGNNKITFNSALAGTQILSVSAKNEEGGEATAVITVVNVAVAQVAPSTVDMIGWSLLFNNSNGDASLPHGTDYGSVDNILGQLYAAEGLVYNNGNAYRFTPSTNMDNLDDANVLAYTEVRSSQATVISGHSSGVRIDPVPEPTWYDGAKTLAQAIKARGGELIWYQGWGYMNTPDWDNIAINFQNMKTAEGGVVIKTAEVLMHFRAAYPVYYALAVGGENVPVTRLHSDTIHGTFALYYLAALTIFRALTGITAQASQYVVPTYFEMPNEFVHRIKNSVDAVQDDYYPGIVAPALNDAPIINDQILSVESGVELVVELAPSTLDPDGQTVTFTTPASADYTAVITDNSMTFTSTNVGLHDIIITAVDGVGGSATAKLSVTVTAAGALKEFWLDFGRTSSLELTTGGSVAWTSHTAAGGNIMSAVKRITGLGGTMTGMLDIGGAVTSNIATATKIHSYGGTIQTGFNALGDVEFTTGQAFFQSGTNEGVGLTLTGPDFTAGDTWRITISGSRTGIATDGSDDRTTHLDVNGIQDSFSSSSNVSATATVVATVNVSGELIILATHKVTDSGAYGYVAGMILEQLT